LAADRVRNFVAAIEDHRIANALLARFGKRQPHDPAALIVKRPRRLDGRLPVGDAVAAAGDPEKVRRQ